jgi:hypothetical protein
MWKHAVFDEKVLKIEEKVFWPIHLHRKAITDWAIHRIRVKN